MNLEDLLKQITPQVYANLKQAIELGKWPNGERLNAEQREHCIQAIIAYEHRNLAPEERSGYIPPKPHQHCGGEGELAEPQDQAIKWH